MRQELYRNSAPQRHLFSQCFCFFFLQKCIRQKLSSGSARKKKCTAKRPSSSPSLFRLPALASGLQGKGRGVRGFSFPGLGTERADSTGGHANATKNGEKAGAYTRKKKGMKKRIFSRSAPFLSSPTHLKGGRCFPPSTVLALGGFRKGTSYKVLISLFHF